jgi:hypothetical protein
VTTGIADEFSVALRRENISFTAVDPKTERYGPSPSSNTGK